MFRRGDMALAQLDTEGSRCALTAMTPRLSASSYRAKRLTLRKRERRRQRSSGGFKSRKLIAKCVCDGLPKDRSRGIPYEAATKKVAASSCKIDPS